MTGLVCKKMKSNKNTMWKKLKWKLIL
jgi:hypothetical protein